MGKFEGGADIHAEARFHGADVRKANTGSDSGTTIGGEVVEGSFSVKVTQGDFSAAHRGEPRAV